MPGHTPAIIRRPSPQGPPRDLLPVLRQAVDDGRELRSRFAALARLTNLFGEAVPLAESLDDALDLVKEAVGARYALLIVNVEQGDKTAREFLTGFEGNPDLRAAVLAGPARTVLENSAPLVMPVLVRESRFPGLRAHVGSVRSLALVPLGPGARRAGVLGVLSGTDGPEYGPEEIDFLTIAASQLQGVVLEATARRAGLDTVVGVVRSLTAALDARDSYTRGHSERVAKYALAVLHELEMGGGLEISGELRTTVRLAAFLHDIGKIGIPDAILQKPGNLSPEEFDEIKKHTLKGAQIVEGVPELAGAIPGIVSHHERWDGKGYPHGLAARDIPLLGKVIGIADALDAITTDRSYKKGETLEAAVSTLRGLAGTQFDPDLVAALVSAHRSGLLDEGSLDAGPAAEEAVVAAHVEIEKIFSREIHDLPALPQIVTQVLERTRDPKCSVREVVKLISHDQALVIKMLRLVNSAYYGFSRKISTINLAVAILGYRVVQNVALNIGVVGVFREIMKSRDERRLALFEHSMESAVVAKALANRFPRLEIQPDEAFTAGLLHDVGKIVLDQYAKEANARVHKLALEKGFSDLEAERAVLGFDHSQIGEWIAMRWNIPPRLREAILYHHKPLAALENAPASYNLTRVTATAAAISDLLVDTSDVDEIARRLEEEGLTEPRLEGPELRKILIAVESEKAELRQILASGDAT